MPHDSKNEFLVQSGPMPQADSASAEADPAPEGQPSRLPRREIGGPAGPEPTRFGDWEHKGRCIDF